MTCQSGVHQPNTDTFERACDTFRRCPEDVKSSSALLVEPEHHAMVVNIVFRNTPIYVNVDLTNA